MKSMNGILSHKLQVIDFFLGKYFFEIENNLISTLIDNNLKSEQEINLPSNSVIPETTTPAIIQSSTASQMISVQSSSILVALTLNNNYSSISSPPSSSPSQTPSSSLSSSSSWSKEISKSSLKNEAIKNQPPPFLNDAKSTTDDNDSSTKISIFTLTILLACIYGLAFVLAVVWIVWLWLRKKANMREKSSDYENHNDLSSINSR